MKMKTVLISFLIISLISISLVYSNGITGTLYKAFSKSVLPDEKIEQNITARKYYNLTIRFRYSMNGSDLSFNDDDGVIVIKNSTGEMDRVTGIVNGKVYLTKDKLGIDSISFVDIYNIEKFETVSNQKTNITFYGTKAYLTVIVSKRQGNATVQGYLIDDLTSQPLDNEEVLIFEKDSDPYIANLIAQSITEDGKYFLTVQTDSEGMTYDVYVKNYQVS